MGERLMTIGVSPPLDSITIGVTPYISNIKGYVPDMLRMIQAIFSNELPISDPSILGKCSASVNYCSVISASSQSIIKWLPHRIQSIPAASIGATSFVITLSDPHQYAVGNKLSIDGTGLGWDNLITLTVTATTSTTVTVSCTALISAIAAYTYVYSSTATAFGVLYTVSET